MTEAIFVFMGCIFLLFINWLVCCCWWLNDKETVAQRIVYITKQFGRLKWFVAFAAVIFAMWGAVMARALVWEFNNEQGSREKIVYKTDETLQKKVDTFLKKHKRMRKYFE